MNFRENEKVKNGKQFLKSKESAKKRVKEWKYQDKNIFGQLQGLAVAGKNLIDLCNFQKVFSLFCD